MSLATHLNHTNGFTIFIAEELHDISAAFNLGEFNFLPGNDLVG